MHSDCKRKSILWVPKLPLFEFAEVTYFQHNDGKRGFGACVPQELYPLTQKSRPQARGGRCVYGEVPISYSVTPVTQALTLEPYLQQGFRHQM